MEIVFCISRLSFWAPNSKEQLASSFGLHQTRMLWLASRRPAWTSALRGDLPISNQTWGPGDFHTWLTGSIPKQMLSSRHNPMVLGKRHTPCAQAWYRRFYVCHLSINFNQLMVGQKNFFHQIVASKTPYAKSSHSGPQRMKSLCLESRDSDRFDPVEELDDPQGRSK